MNYDWYKPDLVGKDFAAMGIATFPDWRNIVYYLLDKTIEFK